MAPWFDRTLLRLAQKQLSDGLAIVVWLLGDVPVGSLRKYSLRCCQEYGELTASSVASLRIKLSFQLRPHHFQVMQGWPFQGWPSLMGRQRPEQVCAVASEFSSPSHKCLLPSHKSYAPGRCWHSQLQLSICSQGGLRDE